MTHIDCTGQPFDLAVEGDTSPAGWTVGYWGGEAVPVYVLRDGTMMIPGSDLRPEWGSNGQPSGRWIDATTGAIMVDGPVPNGTYAATECKLLDSDTNEVILTTATPAQWWASQATDAGHILIDADGDIVAPGTWAAQQPGVRTCYAA